MKYCPECGAEFFEDTASCENCNVALVNDQEWQKVIGAQKAEDQEVFVKILIVDNQFEADVIKDALEKEGLPVLVKSFRDTSFDGIYIPQQGWGSIHVPEEFRQQAKEVIEALNLDAENPSDNQDSGED